MREAFPTQPPWITHPLSAFRDHRDDPPTLPPAHQHPYFMTPPTQTEIPTINVNVTIPKVGAFIMDRLQGYGLAPPWYVCQRKRTCDRK